jgi:cysteine-rich repeat protein
VCTGAPKICVPFSQCHDAGVCNPATGLCASPPKPDGSACNDGFACTDGDACDAGLCAGAQRACPPEDCRFQGFCNPGTGQCEHVNRPDGSFCSDGSACTIGDACLAGSCVAAPVVCPAPNVCQEPGACNPATGGCAYPAKPAGTPCDNGAFCDGAEMCFEGSCVTDAERTVTCSGGCDESNDRCLSCGNAQVDPGEQCDDGNNVDGDGCDARCLAECTTAADCDDANGCTADLCTGGRCQHTSPAGVTCCASDADCTPADTCSAGRCEATGECSFTPAPCFEGVLCAFRGQLGADTCTSVAVVDRIDALARTAEGRLASARARADQIALLGGASTGSAKRQAARLGRSGKKLVRAAGSRLTKALRAVQQAVRKGKITPLCAKALRSELEARICALRAALPVCAPAVAAGVALPAAPPSCPAS